MNALCVLPHGRDQDGNPRQARAVVGYLCSRHRGQLDDYATEIQNLILDTVRITAHGLTNAPREDAPRTRHTKAAEAPAPGDLGIMALYDQRTLTTRLPDDQSEPLAPVLHTVASWLLLVAEERPLTDTLPRSVLAQIDLLVRHGDWIAGCEWVDDYHRELGELRKHLRAAVHEADARPVGRCPSQDGDGAMCGGPLWPDRNGAFAVACGRCGREFGEAFLRHLGGMLAS